MQWKDLSELIVTDEWIGKILLFGLIEKCIVLSTSSRSLKKKYPETCESESVDVAM